MSDIEPLGSDNEADSQVGQPDESEASEAPDGAESSESQAASAPTDEQVASPSGFRRIVAHKAFVPSVLAVVGVALLATRALEPLPRLMRAVAARPEVAIGVLETVADVATRNSPVEHVVRSYERLQHYGVGGAESKLVHIASHARGGLA